MDEPKVPPNAEIIVADKTGKTKSWGRAMGKPYMWTWTSDSGHALTWYYVDQFPIPEKAKICIP